MNRRKTYVMKWPGEKGPSGLAMNCHIRNGQLWYFSTTRGHMIDGRIVEDGEDSFKFEATRCYPGIWEFTLLTIEDFRREVWKIVENSEYIIQAIKTTDDLQEWYRKTFGEEAGINYPDVLEN